MPGGRCDIVIFFFGQSSSFFGTWMTRLATTWLVYPLGAAARKPLSFT
jgi:hypothetical protein